MVTRHSVDRHGRNIYGTPDIPPNQELRERMKSELKQPVIVLNQSHRKVVESAIKELCEQRKYFIRAINVRTNHAHAVVSAQAKPERIADAFKAFATKKLREEGLLIRMCESGLEAEVVVLGLSYNRCFAAR